MDLRVGTNIKILKTEKHQGLMLQAYIRPNASIENLLDALLILLRNV